MLIQAELVVDGYIQVLSSSSGLDGGIADVINEVNSVQWVVN